MTRRGAFMLGWTALATRLFFAAAIDDAMLLNAGWLSVLLAVILSLPLAVSLRAAGDRKKNPVEYMEAAIGKRATRVFALALGLFSLYEAACAVRMLAGTAEYVALDEMPMLWLMVSCTLICGYACARGAQAVASASQIWLRVFFTIMVAVAMIQFKSFEGHWLFPLLGPGGDRLAVQAVPLAGMLTGLFPLWLLKIEPDKGKYGTLKLLAVIGFTAVALLIWYYMLSPAMIGAPDTRQFSLDRLLANGRNAVSLQFLLVLVWYFCLAIQLSFYLLCSVGMLRIAFPKAPEKLCAAALSVAALAYAMLGWDNNSIMYGVNAARYLAVTPAAIAFSVIALIKRRRMKRNA